MVYYRPEGGSDTLDGSYAIAVLNLAQGDRQPNPVLTYTAPGAAAFLPGASDAEGQVFVALSAWDGTQLASVDLATYSSAAVETAPYAQWMDTLASGDRVVAVHASATGFISIFDPERPRDIRFIRGFLSQDLF